MKTLKIMLVNRVLFIVFLTGLFNCCEKGMDNIKLPSLTTVEITDFLQSNAVSGGIITSDGGNLIINRGVCWSTVQNPTIVDSKTIDGSGDGSFSSEMTGLIPNTKYYVRAYATNSIGTEYGNEISFTTLKPFPEPGSTVKDFDNNTYHPIVIGRQVWLIENLRTAHYNNGQPIIQVAGNYDDGGCWDFNDNPETSNIYGKLYNYFAITDSRGICPIGYRIPTEEDWIILTEYLGGNFIAGGKLKHASLDYWKSPNDGATNESGFSALGAGFREMDGTFQAFGYTCYFWSSTAPPTSSQASALGLGYAEKTCGINSAGYKRAGFSVRCIMEPYDAKD